MKMFRAFIISDSQGFTYYSKNNDFEKFNPIINAGFVSAINIVAKEFYEEEIADIYFGMNHTNRITIISKELFGLKKCLYFVFYLDGYNDLITLRALCSEIFIETKELIKELIKSMNSNQKICDLIQEKVDLILNNKYIITHK